jgi:hypothetical protein
MEDIEENRMDKKLFQPIKIRGMELKNRIAFAPFLMVGDGDGSYVGDKMIRWHEARAKGRTGLIMMGAVIVSTAFKRGVVPGRVEVSLYDDKFIPGYARLAEVVHSYGTKIGVQLACVGPLGGIGPSPPPYPDEAHRTLGTGQAVTSMALPVHELSVEEIVLDVEEVTPAGIRIVNRQGERRVLPFDILIIARERVANDSLYNQLQGKVAEVHKIGDCSEVGTIKKAIVGANEVARRI